MQKIREYLRKNPEKVEAVLNYNPSYVFFKIEEEGPLGYLEVKLTPGRSIALDRRIFPLSGLAFIETQKPLIDGDGQIYRWTGFSRFVLNHDTGGAIRGPGRADLFWGSGDYAEIAAGHMQHTGKLYFLILKPDVI
jgi:membrane-bound lytic murein transglycosylase A